MFFTPSIDDYIFLNMQYEIRESFVELAGLLIFIELIGKEKDNIS